MAGIVIFTFAIVMASSVTLGQWAIGTPIHPDWIQVLVGLWSIDAPLLMGLGLYIWLESKP